MNHMPVDILSNKIKFKCFPLLNAANQLQKLRNAKLENRQCTHNEYRKEKTTRNKRSRMLYNHESLLKNTEKYKIEEFTSIDFPKEKIGSKRSMRELRKDQSISELRYKDYKQNVIEDFRNINIGANDKQKSKQHCEVLKFKVLKRKKTPNQSLNIKTKRSKSKIQINHEQSINEELRKKFIMSFRKQFGHSENCCDNQTDKKIVVKINKELNKLICNENQKNSSKVDDYISYPQEKWTINSFKSTHNKENESNNQQKILSRIASQKINEHHNILVNSHQLYNSKNLNKSK